MKDLQKLTSSLQELIDENKNLKEKVERTEKTLKLLLANYPPNSLTYRTKPNDNFFEQTHVGRGICTISLFRELKNGHMEELTQEQIDSYFQTNPILP